MEYRSPIRLVTYTEEPLSPFSHQTLNRARKKLLAEMALQGQEIKLDVIAYTRNDVLSLFDSITDETVWQYHCIVYTHPPLLDFLEHGTFDAGSFKGVEPLLSNEGFVSFVSPCFSQSFQSVSGGLIKQNDFDGLACLLNYQSFILPEHRHDAYHRIRVYLNDLIHLLKNLNWEKLSNDESQLHFLFDGNWISFLNKLPGEFATTRDELVGRLLSVIERLQRKATWYYLHECCLRLQYIECSAAYKDDVNRFEQIIGNNAQKEGSGSTTGTGSSGSGPSAGRVLFAVVWVIIAFFRLATSCGKSNSNTYNPRIAFEPVSNEVIHKVEATLNGEKNRQAFASFLSNMDPGKDTAKVVKNRTGGQPYAPYTVSFAEAEGNTGITVRNKTGFDCLLFYFDGSDEKLEWAAFKPVAYSAYIQNGSKYSFSINQKEGGGFYFYCGRKWVKLTSPIYFPVKNYYHRGFPEVDPSGVVTSQIPVRAGFVPVKDLGQPGLMHSLHLSKHSSYLPEDKYDLLYSPGTVPGSTNGKYKMNLELTVQKGMLKINVRGDLYMLQSKE